MKAKSLLQKEFVKADKLWKIWEIAITDFKLAEKDSKCKINMNVWLIPPNEYHTEFVVCLAGSVIYRRFSVWKKTDDEVYPWRFSKMISDRLEVINYLRMGMIETAYEILYGVFSDVKIPKWKMPAYLLNPKQFFIDANNLLQFLKVENI